MDWIVTYLAVGPKPRLQSMIGEGPTWENLKANGVTRLIDLSDSDLERRYAGTYRIDYKCAKVKDHPEPLELSATFQRVHDWIQEERRAGASFPLFTAPLARQWKVLFNTNRLKPLADMLSEVAEQVVLFGSAAEGKDARDSDVDLFVLSQHEARVKEILGIFRRKYKYSKRLSPIIMGAARLARLRREDPSLYESIVRGRVLWERV